MIKDDGILNIIGDCKSSGYEVGLRDISFALLSMMYENTELAYKSVFGSTDGYKAYVKDGKVSFLKSYIKENVVNAILFGGKDEKGVKTADLSFEENKSEMIALIEKTQQELLAGTIEAKDALKIQADLRIKLNDKFKVAADVRDSVVVVEHKYNSVCEYCGHEIAVPSEEELIKKYNLVHKQ